MLFTFQRYIYESLREEDLKGGRPVAVAMRKVLEEDLIKFCKFKFEDTREYNHNDPDSHFFEFVVNVEFDDMVTEDEAREWIDRHGFDNPDVGMSGTFHPGNYSFNAEKRIDAAYPEPSVLEGFVRYSSPGEMIMDEPHIHILPSDTRRFAVMFGAQVFDDDEAGPKNATEAMARAWKKVEQEGVACFVWDTKRKEGWSFRNVGPDWIDDPAKEGGD